MNERIYGVRFSAHGFGFQPKNPKCNLTLEEAEKQVSDWKLIADTVGGDGEIVTEADLI